MSEVLKKFGRYFLLDRIAQGGMAEIYRARDASINGVNRLLVIKRILPGCSSNPEFVSMFESETKVTMSFNHPNIVQTFDCGEEEGQRYIAMELVDGKNLRQLIQRHAELKRQVPLDLAMYIVEQASAGLHYAHAFKDKVTGEPQKIIHRDISPQNILISYDGHVKVIDFGIAKAETNSESTRAGVIKGKPSYLSPEQISGLPEGEEMDGRCDIFALGAVLWELLTGKKLFAGDNDLSVLKMIEACSTTVRPPSELNPNIPDYIDKAVLRALAKQREKRFTNAWEFQKELHTLIYRFNKSFNPADLSDVVKDLFKGDLIKDRKRVQELNQAAEALLRSGTEVAIQTSGSRSGAAGGEREETTTVFDVRGSGNGSPQSGAAQQTRGGPAGSSVRVARPEVAANAKRVYQGTSGGTGSAVAAPRQTRSTQMSSSASGRSGGGGSFLFLAAAALGAVAFYGPQYGIEVPVLSAYLGAKRVLEPATVELKGDAKAVEVSVNGQVVATELPATIRSLEPETSIPIVVRGSAGTYRQVVNLKSGETRSFEVVMTGGAPANTAGVQGDRLVKTIALRLGSIPAIDPANATVTVNGKPVDFSKGPFVVNMDETVELVVERQGYKPVRREFVIDSRQVQGAREYAMDVALEPLKFGFVTIRTTPSSDAILSLRDGVRTPSSEKPLTLKTPFENQKIPIGTYQVRMVNEVLGLEKTVTISVQEGRSITLEEALPLRR